MVLQPPQILLVMHAEICYLDADRVLLSKQKKLVNKTNSKDRILKVIPLSYKDNENFYTTAINICIPDCQLFNPNTVNNPVDMTCELIGYHCNTTISKTSFINGNSFSFCTPCQDPQYDSSVDNITAAYSQCGQEDSSNDCDTDFCEKCESGQQNKCILQYVIFQIGSICQQGYSLNSDKQCVLRCGEGMFSKFSLNTSNSEQPIGAVCTDCHTDCYSCSDISANSCTSCKNGKYLNITDTILQTGTCLEKNVNTAERYKDFINPQFHLKIQQVSSIYGANVLVRLYQPNQQYTTKLVHLSKSSSTAIEACLNQIQPCCMYQNGVSCGTIQDETCPVRTFNGMFNMISHEASSTAIQTNCEFKNMFYELGSLVKTPLQKPFNITILSSSFQQFSICGAIYSNEYHNNLTVRNSVQLDYPFIEEYIDIHDLITQSIQQRYFNQTFDETLYTQTESNIILDSNKFTDMHTLKRTSTSIEPVPLETRNRGLILHLNDFNGNVIIQNNSFSSIKQLFETCIVNSSLGSTYKKSEQSSTYFENVVLDSLNYLQLQNLITIISHESGLIQIHNNTFEKIGLSSSLIKIESEISETEFQVILTNNTFKNIVGYTITSVFHLTKQSSFKSTSSDSEIMTCSGGTLIENNTFEGITGCHMVHTTALFIGCKEKNTYSSFYSSLETNSQESLFELYGTESSTLLEVYQNKNLSLLATSSETKKVNIYNYLSGLIDTSTSMYIYKTILKNNTFLNCTLGVTYKDSYSSRFYMGSLISLMGILVAEIDAQNFTNIGAMTQEQLNLILSQIGITFTSDTEKEKLPTSSQEFYKGIVGCCLININQMLLLTLKGSYFENIWNIDRFNAFSTSSMQGLILYLKNYYGTLQIGDPTGQTYNTFKNITGLFNPVTVQNFGFNTNNSYYYYQQKFFLGYCSSLFYLSSNQIPLLKIRNFHYQYNFAYYDLGVSSPLAQIISHSQLDGSKYNQYYQLENIYIADNFGDSSSNYFSLSGTIISLSNVTLQNNGKVFDYLNLKRNYIATYGQTSAIFKLILEAVSTARVTIEDSTFTSNNATSSPLK
ncbi:UNKNOWN [Stylonychia lemnae]|uniref:Uncharacterized protein n=1 Tax=Stylonychia lemnae TaxID=5949 RepID=A0A078A4C5_STYLE|nr:UNKNOWN [Stylonychia lemnae]|eukprot:CDW77017.1 UNKNOWN [Stylonychia lemnae]